MKDQANALAQQIGAQLPLKDIHLPPEIGIWPPAPGWWVLLILVLAVIGLSIWLWRRYQRHPVTGALRELKRIDAQYSRDQNKSELALAYCTLLKRTAISIYPRAEVASLTGERWQQFLCEQSVKNAGGEGEVKALLAASCQREPSFVEAAVQRWLRGWLKAQRRWR